jgi:hypothetical protein
MNTTNYPVNFANQRGVPMIASVSVTVNTDNVVIGIPKKAFRGLADSGIIAFRLTQEIPTAGDSLPVVLSSNDFLQTVTLAGGANATGSSFTGTGIYLLWYDKSSSFIQLLN